MGKICWPQYNVSMFVGLLSCLKFKKGILPTLSKQGFGQLLIPWSSSQHCFSHYHWRDISSYIKLTPHITSANENQNSYLILSKQYSGFCKCPYSIGMQNADFCYPYFTYNTFCSLAGMKKNKMHRYIPLKY